MTQIDDADPIDKDGSRQRHRRFLVVFVVGVAIAAVAAIAAVVVHNRNSDDDRAALAARRAAVERRGAHVMPFDQNATMHRFTQNSSGGVETVTVNNANDTKQIDLVQQHLARERALFAVGDFSDPMAIHGMKMPGVQDLQRGAATGRITITYEGIRDGARLTYAASDANLVNALHSWFNAQLMDHGSNATRSTP